MVNGIGKTIKIFLPDGNPTGILTAEIFNWTGKVFVVPRSQLSMIGEREELVQRTGIYFLIGPDPKSTIKEIVYVGESDVVLTRLADHNKDKSKEFWDRAVVVVSKDENLTKSHVRYLEHQCLTIAKEAQSVTIHNTQHATDRPKLPESDVSDMEYFLRQIEMLLPVLNIHFMERRPEAPPASALSADMSERFSPIFQFTGSGFNAEAQEIDGKFVLLKGSKIRSQEMSSIQENSHEIRQQLQQDGLVETNSDSWILKENVGCSSPSSAAGVVAGYSVNGRGSWKVKDGTKTYGQWDEARVQKAVEAAESGSS